MEFTLDLTLCVNLFIKSVGSIHIRRTDHCYTKVCTQLLMHIPMQVSECFIKVSQFLNESE
jgi:hypothetical protein